MADSLIVLSSIVVFGLLIWYFSEGSRSVKIKRKGIRARGVIVENNERSGGHDTLRGPLGGNINNPVIRFTIKDGSEITGEPLTPFISQHEVRVPSYIDIIYDPDNPSVFIIDPD